MVFYKKPLRKVFSNCFFIKNHYERYFLTILYKKSLGKVLANFF
jgi:hypothetical protein